MTVKFFRLYHLGPTNVSSFSDGKRKKTIAIKTIAIKTIEHGSIIV
jgi:hypothetical protein